MKLILTLYICYICGKWAAAMEFTSYLNDLVYCKDTSSIVMQDNNRTWLITKCEEPLPLNPAVKTEQITQLTLEYNEIKRLTQKQFQSLPSIKILKFFENNIRQMNDNSIEGLKYLTNLTIIEPHLAIEELRLSRECKLEKLNLRLRIFDNELLSKLPKDITNITIEDTPVINGEISIPDHLVNLKYLCLKNCSVTTIKGPNFTSSALEYLDLSHNKIEEKTWTWQKYQNLITLILSYNRITSIDEEDFNDLKSLQVLQLNNNKIANVDLNAFRSNLNLSIVDLSHNYLMRIRLNYTEFHNYRVQATCNQMLTEFMPETIFYFNTKNHIECKEKYLNSSGRYQTLLIVVPIIMFIIINSVIFTCTIIQHRRKQVKGTFSNKAAEYDTPIEEQVKHGAPTVSSESTAIMSCIANEESGYYETADSSFIDGTKEYEAPSKVHVKHNLLVHSSESTTFLSINARDDNDDVENWSISDELNETEKWDERWSFKGSTSTITRMAKDDRDMNSGHYMTAVSENLNDTAAYVTGMESITSFSNLARFDSESGASNKSSTDASASDDDDLPPSKSFINNTAGVR